MNRGLIRSLVGIRGALAAVIVVTHLGPFASALVPVLTESTAAVERSGLVALDVFFVLSGFVVTAGYRRTFTSRAPWSVFGRFLWSRLSRFYPLHLAVLTALVLAVLASRVVGHEIPHGGTLGADLLRHLTLTHGWGGATTLTWNGPSWSLSAEWFCYLLVPLLIPLIVRLRSTSSLIAVYVGTWAVVLGVYSVLGFSDAALTYGMALPRALGGFVAGATLQQLTTISSRLPGWAGRRTGILTGASLLAVIGFSWFDWSTVWAAPLGGLVVLALSQERGLLDAFLARRTAVRVGEASVAVYLTHVPWLIGASAVITPARFPGAWGWLGVACLLAGVAVIGWLGFVLVERPSQQWMRTRFRTPARVREQPVTAGE